MNFQALTQYLDTMSERHVPGCGISVWVGNQEVYRHFSGEKEPGIPIRGDEIYWLYSASKVFTMTAAMQLVEQGKIRLQDPVSRYLPAAEHLTVKDSDGTIRPAKTVLTIENLMSMQGGFDYDLNRPAIRKLVREKPDASTREVIDALLTEPLVFDPGTHFQYSLCHDVMAAVIEVVSGMRFGEYLKKNVFEPLGIRDMGFYPNEEQFERMAARWNWDDKENLRREDIRVNDYRLSDNYESGGAGLFGSVDDYVRLTVALANDGIGAGGARILTRESIDNMRTSRIDTPAKVKDFAGVAQMIGYEYGLGVRTLCHPEVNGARSPLGEFGWDGAAAAWTMADPDNHIAAFYAQHVRSCGKAYFEFHPTIRNLIYDCLDL